MLSKDDQAFLEKATQQDLLDDLRWDSHVRNLKAITELIASQRDNVVKIALRQLKAQGEAHG